MCASEGDLCYHLHNAVRPMTGPKNTEDQELSLDQLKDAAGGFGDKLQKNIFRGSSDSSKYVADTSKPRGSNVAPTDETQGPSLMHSETTKLHEQNPNS